MPDQPYDRSGKWLVDNEGRAHTFVGGLREVTACRAVPTDVVQPRQLPDGLLEVTLRGRGRGRCCCWSSSAPTPRTGCPSS